MALQVWLPLNKSGADKNQGLGDSTITNFGAVYESSGKLGGCYKCTNSAGIRIESKPWMKMVPGNSFSVSMWIKGCSGNTWAIACTSWELNFRTSVLSVYPGGALSNGGCAIYQTFDNDTWYHIAFSYNGDTPKLSLYLNGEFKQEYVTTYMREGITSTITLPYGDTRYINDFRIYDHCLSPKEVKEISKGLVLHYPLNDIYNGSYNLLNDSDTFTNWGDYEAGYTEIKINEFGRKSLIITNKRSWCGAIHSVQIPSAGTYTISCYCKPISRTKTSIKQTLYISGNGLNDQSVEVDWNKTNQWQRLSLTRTYNQAGSFFVYLIAYGGSRTDDYKVTCEYTMPQVTKTDTTVPYVEKSIPDLTVYDCSGYQNNGTISGSLSCSTNSSRYKISTVFDGISSKIINDSFPASIVSGTNSFTICGWAYCIKGNSYNPLFHIGSSYRTTTGICLHGNGDRIEGLDINGTTINNTHGSGYSNEKWVHQCIVYDGTTIKRYLNGNSTPIQSIACSGFKSDNNKLSVGGFWGIPFKGYLSDFRVYATALSEEDIKELYNTSCIINS